MPRITQPGGDRSRVQPQATVSLDSGSVSLEQKGLVSALQRTAAHAWVPGGRGGKKEPRLSAVFGPTDEQDCLSSPVSSLAHRKI